MLKGIDQPLLLEERKKKAAPKPPVEKDTWTGVNRELLEALRSMRRALARQKAVPAYTIFNDVTLRDLARKQPRTPEAMLRVAGIGLKKRDQYGEQILQEINKHCAAAIPGRSGSQNNSLTAPPPTTSVFLSVVSYARQETAASSCDQ